MIPGICLSIFFKDKAVLFTSDCLVPGVFAADIRFRLFAADLVFILPALTNPGNLLLRFPGSVYLFFQGQGRSVKVGLFSPRCSRRGYTLPSFHGRSRLYTACFNQSRESAFKIPGICLFIFKDKAVLFTSDCLVPGVFAADIRFRLFAADLVAILPRRRLHKIGGRRV